MPDSMKVLRPGERRFTAKQRGAATSSPWGVYDKARGSWPTATLEYGRVNQEHPKGAEGKASAEAEADRLESRVTGLVKAP